MAISIEGIRIPRFSTNRDKETGQLKVSGDYELMSNAGVVLAKQSFNGYESLVLPLSSESTKLVTDLMASLQNDLNQVLGIA